jgi:transposase-like protein
LRCINKPKVIVDKSPYYSWAFTKAWIKKYGGVIEVNFENRNKLSEDTSKKLKYEIK